MSGTKQHSVNASHPGNYFRTVERPPAPQFLTRLLIDSFFNNEYFPRDISLQMQMLQGKRTTDGRCALV